MADEYSSFDQSFKDHLFDTLIERSPLAMALFYGPQFVITLANKSVLAYWGRTYEQVINKPLFEALPKASGQDYQELLNRVYTTGDRVVAKELVVNLERNGQLEQAYINFVYEPFYGVSGAITGVTVVCTEVTQQVLDRKALEESERQFRSLIEEAPVATCLFVGQDLVIEVVNQVMLGYWGRDKSILGKPLVEAFPKLKGQHHLQILDEVFRTGITYEARQVRADLKISGKLTTFYFNLIYKSLCDAAGEVYGIMAMSVDVTEQVLARQQLEEKEHFAQTVFYNSPVAKLVYVGPDMILREANEKMLDIFGRDASILGKPLLDAIPELTQTPFVEQYRQVLATGEIHEEVAQRIELVKNGEIYWGYYDYTYKPLLDASGHLYGVICTMIEVTRQVVAQQKVEEAEAGLRGAVEMAQLGTWSIDVATGGLTYSNRLIDWFGYDPGAQDYNQVIPILSAADQERVAVAVAQALNPESDGIYDEIYTVIHPQTGQKRILHAHGKTVFDATGKAIRLNGTAQDITLQQELQLALESQVRARTEELEAANEELAASNEEYATLNEELEEANQLLIRSNDNLQQFAYVASHDLQEPLRKIQQFGDLLKTRHTALSGEELLYIDRMQAAASRMSTLIRDLLNFSRLSTQRETTTLVALNEVVQEVLTTLELVIAQTGAQLHINLLPTIQGDATQLAQLFQNLLSNALKFRQVTVSPRIQINAYTLSLQELPAWVKPSRAARSYYQIDVVDNGVGFDEKYLDRIFQVFQRLHGKSEFAGTGIGLAICERVVANHGGALTARSQVGQGATFSVYFPG